MSNLDESIEKAKRQYRDHVRKLKREAKAEEARLHAKVVELLKRDDEPAYEVWAQRAREALENEKKDRKKRAKEAAAARRAEVPSDSTTTSILAGDVSTPSLGIAQSSLGGTAQW